MYRKFEFAAQPFFEINPAVQHPDFELIFSGVVEVDIEGEWEVSQLYIGETEFAVEPKASNDWRNFNYWLRDRIINSNPKDQDAIKLPPGNMYDLFAPSKKPASNARQTPVPA